MTERPVRQVRIRSDKDNDKPKGSYDVEVTCTNCDWDGEVAIPKGHAIEYGAPVERFARCEDCGCYTLVRCDYIEPEAETPETGVDHVRILRELQEQADGYERQRRGRIVPTPPYPIPTPAPDRPYRGIDHYRLGDPPSPDYSSSADNSTWRVTTSTDNTTAGSTRPEAIGTSVPPVDDTPATLADAIDRWRIRAPKIDITDPDNIPF
jgi:hypothetical protein